jgi:hypothetical protein
VTVQFSSSVYATTEQAGQATIVATLNTAAAFAVTVNYTTNDGTALANSDYTAASGVLTFQPGETSKTFVVAIIDDALDEADETILLALSNPVNALLGTPVLAVLTVGDNDLAPVVQFSSFTYVAAEGAGSALITATLSAVSGLTATVDYAASDGTATAGSDYTATVGALTFNPRETLKTFTVPILDDALYENDETVQLLLTNPSNASLGVPFAAELTIVNTTPEPIIQFSGDHYVVSEDAGSIAVTVTLSAPSARLIAVDYATSDGAAIAGSDYTSANGVLTFIPGEISKALAVPIVNDGLYELDESFSLTLAAPTSASLGAPNSVTITILDDDGSRIYLPVVLLGE